MVLGVISFRAKYFHQSWNYKRSMLTDCAGKRFCGVAANIFMRISQRANELVDHLSKTLLVFCVEDFAFLWRRWIYRPFDSWRFYAERFMWGYQPPRMRCTP